MAKDDKAKESYVNGISPVSTPQIPSTKPVEWLIWVNNEFVGFLQVWDDKMPERLKINGFIYEKKERKHERYNNGD